SSTRSSAVRLSVRSRQEAGKYGKLPISCRCIAARLTFSRHLRNHRPQPVLQGSSGVSHNPLRLERFSAGRRAFLRRSGAVVLAAAPVAAWARTAECRSLSFVHTHTGETLDCTYYQGGYAPTQLARVNHFLLDILFDLKTRSGSDEPFHVISGYRSPRTNAMLRRRSSGVAARSLHMRGQA